MNLEYAKARGLTLLQSNLNLLLFQVQTNKVFEHREVGKPGSQMGCMWSIDSRPVVHIVKLVQCALPISHRV